MNYLTDLFTPVQPNLLIQGDYSLSLVALSVFIAIVASFMGMQVSTASAVSSNKKRRYYTKIAGSIALGGGVWSMHFIGMLAFQLCTTVEYNFTITSLSLIPSLLASRVTLTILTQSSVKPHQIIIGGITVGAGIGAMHYSGMAAMEMKNKA